MRAGTAPATVAAVVTALLTALVTAPPAAAAPGPGARTCGDSVERTVVTGDVEVVGTCRLLRVVVLGDVHVAPGARAYLVDSQVVGDLHVGRDARATAQGTDVRGGVHLDDALQLRTTGAVGRSVRGRATEVEIAGRVAGAVNVAFPFDAVHTGLFLHGATVGGWVNVYGGQNVVLASRLGRGLTLSWSRRTAVCETTVQADVTVRRARRDVQLGDVSRLSPEWLGCSVERLPVRGQYRGDLVLEDNVAGVAVENTDVAGDLVCRRNDVVPVLTSDVTVGGSRVGQCG
ncbi:hypothetical protein AB6N23_17160 [Cellulomonas sp. 179-A 9B4 NHS]|uniref:hypothetical protein n=1 Tax=Cellulomonas sp. 179-A 9B4 NHS TaxID=3142379 RepID=UPI0039A03757